MTLAFPPPGFVAVPSAVEGITVYAPAAVTETPPPVVDFKCPRCGAVLTYQVTATSLQCAYCGYTEQPQALASGKAALHHEFTVEVLAAARGWGELRQELVCQSCGAHLALAPDQLTATCPFCGSHRVVHRAAPHDWLRPQGLIPFQVDAEACRALVRTWLGSSWMTPTALQQAARGAEFIGLYLPFWIFGAQATANWQAEVGYRVTERRWVGGHWRKRTRIVWRGQTGQVHQQFEDWLIAGTGQISRQLLRRLQTYDLQALVAYNPKFLAGFQAQAYDLPLEGAWESARAEMREQIRQAALNAARQGGHQVRNLSLALDFAAESWRYVLLPVYLAVYRYRERPYHVLVNGQTGLVVGQRPVAWRKVGLALGAALMPGVLLILVSLITNALGRGVSVGGLGGALLLGGIGVAIILFHKARTLNTV